MVNQTLWDTLDKVPDRRGRKGRQYSLRSILGISLAAMLACANDLRAIFRWGRRLPPQGLEAFGIENGKAPCHSTYHYFFAALDAQALSDVLGRYVFASDDPDHVAIDGKSLRGSKRGEEKAVHVLSAFASELGGVIGDLVVEPEANEIVAALELLKRLPLEGTVITGDAIFTQRRICEYIQQAGGDYLFTAKANQPGLLSDIQLAMGDDSPLGRAATGFA